MHYNRLLHLMVIKASDWNIHPIPPAVCVKHFPKSIHRQQPAFHKPSASYQHLWLKNFQTLWTMLQQVLQVEKKTLVSFSAGLQYCMFMFISYLKITFCKPPLTNMSFKPFYYLEVLNILIFGYYVLTTPDQWPPDTPTGRGQIHLLCVGLNWKLELCMNSTIVADVESR